DDVEGGLVVAGVGREQLLGGVVEGDALGAGEACGLHRQGGDALGAGVRRRGGVGGAEVDVHRRQRDVQAVGVDRHVDALEQHLGEDLPLGAGQRGDVPGQVD